MKVNSIMSAPVATVPEGMTLDRVAHTMLTEGIGSVVVVDGAGNATGILTERDFQAREPSNPFQKHRPTQLFGHNVRRGGLDRIYAEARHLRAGDVQRPLTNVLEEDDPVERAVDAMNRHQVLHLVVVRDGHPIGVVSRHDLLRLAVAPSLA